MILEQITLNNFGVYKGEHIVNLKPHTNKPIILFGAYNGSGKTTFLEALQLVLYGKSAKTAGRGKMAYEEYLESLINRDVPKKQGAGLTLEFSSRQNGKEEKIKIARTWLQSGNAIKEKCDVFRNDAYDQSASDRWGEFVEEFMPSQISELFFFDGEKIEGLADPIRSSGLLKTGIYSLLGINAIENLIKSLVQIEKKKTLEASLDGEKESFAKEELLAADLAQRREDIVFNIANVNAHLDKNISNISTIEANLKLSGADLLLDRHNLQESHAVLSERIRFLNNQLIDLTAGQAPLALVESLILELREIKINSSGFNKENLNLLEEEYRLALTGLAGSSDVSATSLAAFEDFFKERISSIRNSIDEYSVDIAINEIPSENDLNELKIELKKLLLTQANNDQELDRLNRSLAAVPAEDKVKSIIVELNQKQAEKNKNEGKLELLQEEFERIDAEQEGVSKVISAKLLEIANKKTGTAINQRIISHSSRSRSTLSAFKAALLKRHVHTLSEEITKCFGQLHRKTKQALTFNVDVENFSLAVRKHNGDLILASSLSAGERQLLAVAILWALAKSSGKVLPTVIDTPLGRLDGPHRKKLISNYFPVASPQVLIFSTDEEITAEHYEALKPFIAKEYKINYNEDTESSAFENGYFQARVVSK